MRVVTLYYNKGMDEACSFVEKITYETFGKEPIKRKDENTVIYYPKSDNDSIFFSTMQDITIKIIPFGANVKIDLKNSEKVSKKYGVTNTRSKIAFDEFERLIKAFKSNIND